MLKVMLVLVFLLCGILGLSAQAPNWDWVTKAGSTDEDSGTKVCYDAAGNMYATGYFSETASFGPFFLTSAGSIDVFVAKMDAAGNWLWAVRGGGTNADLAWGIAATFDGCYITGNFYGTAIFGSQTFVTAGNTDIFVSRLSSSGNWLWTATAGGAGMDRAWNLTVDNSGNCFVTGDFDQTAYFSPSIVLVSLGSQDVFVASVTPSGTWQWAKGAGGTAAENGYGITASGGRVYIAGVFQSTAQFGPISLVGNGYSDIYIATLDINGNWLYATGSSGVGDEWANDISHDDQGNIYICGSYFGEAVFGAVTLPASTQYNGYVIKCDMLGSCLWATPFVSDSYNEAWGIAADDNGYVYTTGSYNGQVSIGTHSLTEQGGADSFTVKLDSSGNPLWAKSIGDSAWDCTFSVCANGAGIGITGYFTDSCTADGQTLVSYGYMDVLLAGLSGSSLARPEGIDISEIDGDVYITWLPGLVVDGYFIYRSPDPYATDWGLPYSYSDDETWLGTGLAGERWFFRVTADYGED